MRQRVTHICANKQYWKIENGEWWVYDTLYGITTWSEEYSSYWSDKFADLFNIRERIASMEKLDKCKELIEILTPYIASDSAKVNAKKLLEELNQ